MDLLEIKFQKVVLLFIAKKFEFDLTLSLHVVTN